MQKSARAALCLLACALAGSGLEATTVVERSAKEMTQDATLIVTGHCTQQKTTWVGRQIMTLATVSVTDTLKGTPPSGPLTIVLPGGADTSRKFPVAQFWPGAPTMSIQDNVLLFLAPQSLVPGTYSIVGFSQGLFQLVADSQGNTIATQSLSGLSLQGPQGQTRPGAAKTYPFEQFRQQILETIAAGRQ